MARRKPTSRKFTSLQQKLFDEIGQGGLLRIVHHPPYQDGEGLFQHAWLKDTRVNMTTVTAVFKSLTKVRETKEYVDRNGECMLIKTCFYRSRKNA